MTTVTIRRTVAPTREEVERTMREVADDCYHVGQMGFIRKALGYEALAG